MPNSCPAKIANPMLDQPPAACILCHQDSSLVCDSTNVPVFENPVKTTFALASGALTAESIRQILPSRVYSHNF